MNVPRESPLRLRVSPLARFLLAAYVLLVAYASLYPFSGWKESGASAFAFLAAPWPRYVTAFDVAANVCGYFPLGLLAVLALRSHLSAPWAWAAATATGAALSVALEAVQTFLPPRIPSNLDVLANATGTGAGALAGIALAHWLLATGPLQRLRTTLFAPGAPADFGLMLLGLWFFAQLNPATLLFGGGDLRDLVSAPPGPVHAVGTFVLAEALTTGGNLAAVLLLAGDVVRSALPARMRAGVLVAVLAGGLAVRMLAFATLMRAENVFAWLTPGAQLGIAAGAGAAALAALAPRTVRLALAAMLLMAATVLVNLAPPNPYLAATLKVWEQGHFLNFNGLTRLVGVLWPFAAMGYLIWLAAARQAERVR